jgi:ribosomal protein L9
MGVITTATALTAAGLAVSAGTAGMSFAQAGKQRRMQREAERDAAQAMGEARKKLEVNYYEQLGIKKEPYELAREAAISSGAQLIEAGREGEQRGIGAVAGRVQMAQNEAQGQIRSAMGQEMMGLEKLVAGEESRLRDMGVNLDLAEAQGAQLAARDAQEAAASYTTQGMQGLQQLGQQAIQAAPLYDKTASAKIAGNITQAGEKLNLGQTDIQKSVASLGNIGGVDLRGVANMKPLQYQDFMQSLSPDVLRQIQSAIPNSFSSFRPSEYALPKPQVPGMSAYSIPGIGG